MYAPNTPPFICKCSKCREEKVKKINQLYGTVPAKRKFSDLRIDDKIFLARHLKKNEYKNMDFVNGSLFRSELIDLLEKRNIISISNLSPLDAFDLDSVRFPCKYNKGKAIYYLNIYFTQEEIDSILCGRYEITKLQVDEKIEMFYILMHQDVMQKFTKMMNDRKLDLVVLENAENKFKDLYEHLAYSEIITLCYEVAKFCLDKTTIGDMTCDTAANGAISMVTAFYEHHKETKWPIRQSEVGYCGKTLRMWIENILKKDVSILNTIISSDSIVEGEKSDKHIVKTLKKADDGKQTE